jgi:hypothetical protein
LNASRRKAPVDDFKQRKIVERKEIKIVRPNVEPMKEGVVVISTASLPARRLAGTRARACSERPNARRAGAAIFGNQPNRGSSRCAIASFRRLFNAKASHASAMAVHATER